MKTVVLLTRRNVGLCALSYLVAQGLVVKVISDDENVLWMADALGCEIVTLETMDDYDLLLSVHWHKIIPVKYLNGICVNVHPCLENGYKGKNPVLRYIQNKNTDGSVSSHYMTEIVDEGEVIHTENFITGMVETYQQFYDAAVPSYFKLLDRTLKIVL